MSVWVVEDEKKNLISVHSTRELAENACKTQNERSARQLLCSGKITEDFMQKHDSGVEAPTKQMKTAMEAIGCTSELVQEEMQRCVVYRVTEYKLSRA